MKQDLFKKKNGEKNCFFNKICKMDDDLTNSWCPFFMGATEKTTPVTHFYEKRNKNLTRASMPEEISSQEWKKGSNAIQEWKNDPIQCNKNSSVNNICLNQIFDLCLFQRFWVVILFYFDILSLLFVFFL